MRYEDENIWLTQKMMATLYDVGLPTINEHIKKIYADSELEETATIRNFRIVQTEGSRQVTRNTKHYNLQMIIAVGFKVNNERADADKPHMGLTTWAAAPGSISNGRRQRGSSRRRQDYSRNCQGKS